MKKFVAFSALMLLLFCALIKSADAAVMPPHKMVDFKNKIAFTEDEKEWFKKHPTLKVAVLKNYYPYEYVDANGIYKGIASTYLYEIERETGISFEVVPFEHPIQAINAFNKGEVDIFSLAVDTDVYSKNSLFSSSYLSFNVGIFTNGENRLLINSMDDLKGKKVAVYRPTLIFFPIEDSDFELIVVESVVDGLKGISKGTYDAYIGDIFNTKSVIVRVELDNVYLATSLNNSMFTISIGLLKKHKMFVPIVNKIISKFNHLTQLQVMEIWTKSNKDSPEMIQGAYQKYLFIVSLLFLAVLLGLYLRLLQIKLKSKKINELRKDYKNLFDGTPVAMFVHKNNRILYVNKAFAKLVGEDEKSLLSGSSFDFINASFIKPAKRHNPDKKLDIEEDIKIYDINGNIKYINLKSINIKIGNQSQELIIVVDVTYRKVLEDERRDILKKVASIQKMESVGLLASKVAHDFNNILAGINGAAEFMNMNISDNNPLKKYPEIIINACHRAAYLTKQLLFFSKDKTHVLKNINLNNCVEEGVALLEQAVKNNPEIKIVSNIKAKDSNIIGNEDLLENIVINLGINSRDAFSEKGGNITIETKDIVLTKRDIEATMFDVEDGEYVELSVEDNGRGIPYDIQNKIFEPFFSTKGPDKGNGLGLFAVYGVIREHKATMKLQSIPGEGTKISIFFPLIKSEKKISSARKSKKKIKAKILLVDDEEILLSLLKDILEYLGAKVVVAKSYDEAMERYNENQDVDLIMLDVVMPGRGGLDVYKSIRAKKEDIKAIFISGYTADDEIGDMIPRNKNLGFIAKPYNVSEVAEKITDLLKK
ncbi:MAG: transporter substrate-binding domain-containing protein [Lactobacillaceae bacterium]|nr:transporter substrate-binding domain-containing protein [Lactobacillaceae bacterium]